MSNEYYTVIGIARCNGVVVYTTTARERGVLRILKTVLIYYYFKIWNSVLCLYMVTIYAIRSTLALVSPMIYRRKQCVMRTTCLMI